MTRLLALPLALAGLVILGVVGMIERREAKRVARLDALWERVRRDLDEEERDTLVPPLDYEAKAGMSIVDGNVVRRVTWDGPALNSYKSGAA